MTMLPTCCCAIVNGKLQEAGMESWVGYNADGRMISGMGADFGDVDGDGRADIVVTGLRGETFELFHNNGDGTFDDQQRCQWAADTKPSVERMGVRAGRSGQ